MELTREEWKDWAAVMAAKEAETANVWRFFYTLGWHLTPEAQGAQSRQANLIGTYEGYANMQGSQSSLLGSILGGGIFH